MNIQMMLQGFLWIMTGIITILIAQWMMRNAARQGEFCGTPEGNIIVGGFPMALIGVLSIFAGLFYD